RIPARANPVSRSWLRSSRFSLERNSSRWGFWANIWGKFTAGSWKNPRMSFERILARSSRTAARRKGGTPHDAFMRVPGMGYAFFRSPCRTGRRTHSRRRERTIGLELVRERADRLPLFSGRRQLRSLCLGGGEIRL